MLAGSSEWGLLATHAHGAILVGLEANVGSLREQQVAAVGEADSWERQGDEVGLANASRGREGGIDTVAVALAAESDGVANREFGRLTTD